MIAPPFSSTASDQYPTSSSQYPTTSSHYPATSSKYHETSSQYPATSCQFPASSCQYTINQYCTKSAQDPITTAPVPGSTNTQSSEEYKIQLREMFPNKELTAIESAIANCSDLEGAISVLLGEADEHGNCTDLL